MDPYATLGIDRSASDAEIRSAYRKLAKKYHPDLNPGNREAEEKFKAIGKANEILGDKEKRARFDRGEIDADGNERGFAGGFGGGQSRGHAGGGFGGGSPFGAGGINPGDLEDLINAFGGGQGFGGFGGFGAGGRHARQPRSRRGQDMRAEMTIPFVQAVLGGRQEIRLDGQPVAVTIPPGIVDGTVMRLRGRGGKGYSATGGSPAPDGDLLLTIHVENDSHYVREGRNLRSTRDIDLQTAVLGGKIEVSTPKGPVMVNVKPHSDTGTALRLAGRGVAAHKSQPAGDLFVTLRIRLGEKDPELEAFFRKRAEKDSQNA